MGARGRGSRRRRGRERSGNERDVNGVSDVFGGVITWGFGLRTVVYGTKIALVSLGPLADRSETEKDPGGWWRARRNAGTNILLGGLEAPGT